MDKKKFYKYVLSLGHCCSDINQGALSAVLPFLIAAYHYDYTTAAMLVTVSNVFGSIVQPVFGNIADKKNKPWIMTLGVALAGGGMALTGLSSNFYFLCVAVIISGIGIAMFHPQAAQLVSRSTVKSQHGKGISIFSFGGKMGFTLGPILTSFAITVFGMKGTLLFLVPVLIFGGVSSLFLKDFEELNRQDLEEGKLAGASGAAVASNTGASGAEHSGPKHSGPKHAGVEPAKTGGKGQAALRKPADNWSAFGRLCVVVFGRSIISNGMSTFLALYFIQVLSQKEALGNSILSVYYGIGALCVLLGGGLADRVGHEKLIRVSFAIFFPCLILFTLTHNLIFSIVMLIPLTCAESLSYSPMVVLGQQYLPNRTGFASGVTLGLAVSVGAIICPLLGIVADRFGLPAALYVIAAVGAVAFAASLLLPKPEAV